MIMSVTLHNLFQVSKLFPHIILSSIMASPFFYLIS